jgi:hypothetical protein
MKQEHEEHEEHDDGKKGHLVIAIGFLKHPPKKPKRGEPKYPKIAKNYLGK